MNSRRKGVRGELEARDLLREHGFEARRGQQFQGTPGSPDVVCEELGDWRLEVKRTERLQLYEALEQAKRERREGQAPVVLHKKNGKPWVVVMYAEDWMVLVKRLKEKIV
jgi:Holliday junction resolvase